MISPFHPPLEYLFSATMVVVPGVMVESTGLYDGGGPFLRLK